MKADFKKGTKVCSRCKRELPISEFNKNKSKNDCLESECIECRKEYRKTDKGKATCKKYSDKYRNTFGRIGHRRGMNGLITKRDYELTEKQLKRRNKSREYRNYNKRDNPHGILVWYDGALDNLSTEEYTKIMKREYSRQMNCAVRGYIGRVKPSEHFLFDFDLEQMLKDNVYYRHGNGRKYITKWWKGQIRHWTVNDGIWKE